VPRTSPRGHGPSVRRTRRWATNRGRPEFPGPERVVRVWGRVMRARCSGRRRKRVRRDSRRNSPSSDIRPVPHADRVGPSGHPRLMSGEPAAEWVSRSSWDHRD